MEEPGPVGKVPRRDAEKKRNSHKDLPATLRAALPTMLREVFRVSDAGGRKGAKEEEKRNRHKRTRCGAAKTN